MVTAIGLVLVRHRESLNHRQPSYQIPAAPSPPRKCTNALQHGLQALDLKRLCEHHRDQGIGISRQVFGLGWHTEDYPFKGSFSGKYKQLRQAFEAF